MHHAQVHDRADATAAEDVLCFTPTHIDLVVHDVSRHTVEASAIDPDDWHVAMQATREQLTHAPADAGDYHRAAAARAAAVLLGTLIVSGLRLQLGLGRRL